MKQSDMHVTNMNHLHYKCKELLSAAEGARDMLFEAEKQFKINGDIGHSEMCRLHKEKLNKFYCNK